MLDLMDYRIAQRLSEHHLYPFAQNIYIKIYRSFSHFPLDLDKINIKGEGKTVTLMAYSTCQAFDASVPSSTFHDVFGKVYHVVNDLAQPHLPQGVRVECFLGCMLFYYHPADLHDAISMIKPGEIFDENQIYEFDFKKKTLLSNAL